MSGLICRLFGHKWIGAFYDTEAGCYYSVCKRINCDAGEYIT
jgi:hypothetical protein